MRALSLITVSALSLLVLAGCPDPTSTAEGTAASGGPGPASGPPSPNGPGAPASGTAPAGAGRPVPAGFKVASGDGVKLTGTINYAGSKTGTLRLDFLKPPSNGALPELIESIELKGAGPWEVEAPKNAGDLAIVAYLDGADDGPSAGDPAGRVGGMITVKSDPVAGLDIKLEDEPDLGDLTPGQPGALPNAPPPPVDPAAQAPTPATPPDGSTGAPSTASGAAVDPNAGGAAGAEGQPKDAAAGAAAPAEAAPTAPQ